MVVRRLGRMHAAAVVRRDCMWPGCCVMREKLVTIGRRPPAYLYTPLGSTEEVVADPADAAHLLLTVTFVYGQQHGAAMALRGHAGRRRRRIERGHRSGRGESPRLPGAIAGDMRGQAAGAVPLQGCLYVHARSFASYEERRIPRRGKKKEARARYSPRADLRLTGQYSISQVTLLDLCIM